MAHHYKRVVIKIGSNIFSQKNGLPDYHRIEKLVAEMASIKASGAEIILVSSGAVASGRGMISISEKHDAVAARQLLASIGQVKLINTYTQFFEQFNIQCAQVLVTKEDFRDRMHYLNMRNCLEILLQHQVIPVVNENDVVSVTELMFTDNDELASLIAAMLNAEALIILTNVDGIFDGDPKLPGSKLIEQINDPAIDFSNFISSGKSLFGRGGMITKSTMAQKTASLGIAVHIANGTKENILQGLLAGDIAHTRFVANKKASGKKKWIVHAASYANGLVVINEGAKLALRAQKATSLLPVGIINIETDFKKGDVIRLIDEQSNSIGLGIAEYGADKAREWTGLKNQKPLIHYDYLYLYN
jgi:glutamate 5-kinase